MLNALEELENLGIMLNVDDYIAEEYVIYYYIAIRLKQLLKKYGTTEEDINGYCECLADNYYDYEISIDIMVNAIYNYYNIEGKKLDKELLRTGIDTFLEEYGEMYDEEI